MVILKQVRFLSVFLLSTAFLSNSYAEVQCPEFQSGILITNWETPSPVGAKMYQYKKNSNFAILEESNLKILIREGFNSFKKYRFIGIDAENSGFPIDADYRLIIDGKLEFRISDLISTDRGYAGCPLKSARVNNCQAHVGRALVFNQSCGIHLEDKK